MQCAGAACHIVDISETGAKIVCEPSTTPKTVGETVDLTSPQLGTVEGKIIWKQSGGKKDTFAVVFNKTPLTVRQKVIKVISDQNKGYHDN